MVDEVSKRRQLVGEDLIAVRGSSMCKVKGIKQLTSSNQATPDYIWVEMRPHLWATLGVSPGLLTTPGQASSSAMPEGFQSLPMFSSHVSQAHVTLHNRCSELGG